MSDKGVAPDSHSALFGLEGKRPSTTPGAGAGSGIIGTSGHSGSANKGSVAGDSDKGSILGRNRGGSAQRPRAVAGVNLLPVTVPVASGSDLVISSIIHGTSQLQLQLPPNLDFTISTTPVPSIDSRNTLAQLDQSHVVYSPASIILYLPTTALSTYDSVDPSDDKEYIVPPPQTPTSDSEPSSLSAPSQRPPPFSSLYFPTDAELDSIRATVAETSCESFLATVPAPSFEEALAEDDAQSKAEAETKAALPQDTKAQSSKANDEGEPPPPYTEGSSPVDSFTYVMAAAGGAASIITQVQQTAGPPINTLGGEATADEHITLDLRGTQFTLSRDELLTLPEFVLLSLFPNGLLPDGHMNAFHDGDVYPVDYDPASLQYMLNFFREVAQSIPSASPSPTTPPENDPMTIEPLQGSTKDMLQDRAGIIVLREDLDFYVIPPRPDIEAVEMTEVKRAAGRCLLKQNGIFSGLKRSEEVGTTEQHLIEMLTAGGFDHDDTWGHRAGEPNKAVICSLALARLRTDIKGDIAGSNAVGMAQKLLLFWRKPARRCWWEGVELENVEGVEGKVKVWIRRVWTLEMSVIGLR
ncbi:hypothetical protein ABEF94_014307 [Exophiala dermatitidis]